MNTNVITFPLYRQQKLLSGIANVLRSKQGEDATRFWRGTAKDLLQQLTANGVDGASAEEEVRKLLYAVLSLMETDAVEARG